jgi:hypothetical protein
VENIMLDASGHVKLIDFGLSQEITEEEEPMSPIGSLIYMAPELLTKSAGGRHTDWWALGVLAHEMMTGRSPWSSLTDKKLIKRQIKTLKIAPPKSLSPAAGDFICKLLVQDHKKRLGTGGASEVKSADFFEKGAPSGERVNWAQLEKGSLPPGLTPPRVAFIEAECANALAMYRGVDLEPANWALGVEAVPSLPQCANVGGILGGGGGGCEGGSAEIGGAVSDALSEALSQTSLEEKGSEPALPPPAQKHVSMVPPPAGSGGSGSGGGGGGGGGAGGGRRGRASSDGTKGDGGVGMRRGATPRGPKPKTPKYTAGSYGQAAVTAGGGDGGSGGGGGGGSCGGGAGSGSGGGGRTPKSAGGFGRSSKANTPKAAGGSTWR